MIKVMSQGQIVAIVLLGLASLSACVRNTTTNTVPLLTVTAGGGHSCRTTTAGTVECWGANFVGQTGNGRQAQVAPIATVVPGVTGATLVASGIRSHTCALAGGQVQCWGDNTKGQLGVAASPNSLVPVGPALTGVTDVSAGGSHTCAVLTGGSVRCWGDNTWGQLGNGNKINSATPVVANVTGATRVIAGNGHSCAIVASGAIKCWGLGWLGDGPPATTAVLTPVTTANIVNATTISSGVSNTCALLSNGTAWCWGPNAHAELGNGTTTNSNVPVQVSGVAGATAIAIGGSHACAVVANGEVMCWGDNTYGQVARNSKTGPDQCGIGTGISCSKSPIKVAGISGAVDVAAGDSHSCAILADGRTKCWGWNGYGQLGNGAHGNGGMFPISSLPQWVTRKAIAVGGNFASAHSCALYGTGSIKCWGYNGNGALGNGQTSLTQGTPVQVSGITNAVTVSAGGHTCATLDDGSMSCWGPNSFRQIGPNAAHPQQLTPIAILSGVAAPMAGRNSTCAIRADQGGMRGLFCFGVNNNGQLGESNAGMAMCSSGGAVPVVLPCRALPTEVPGLAVVSVGGGAEHTCAILDDGTARCWGQSLFSQLGSNTAGLIKVVPGITSALSIAVGGNHNCSLIADGTVKCWGRNRFGQLGDGTLTESLAPVTVSGITNATAVIASSESSCALLADGAIKCWGDNGVGQLGTGTTTGPETCVAGGSSSTCSKTPVAVSVVSDATAISSSIQAGNLCAVRANGDVFCWGANAAGELGRGTSGGVFPTPAAVIGL